MEHENSEPKTEKGTAYAVVNVRDVNLICEEYGQVYALLEEETRRRKINCARRRPGVLEIRTVAYDEWKEPVAWIECLNGLDVLVRYSALDIR